MKLSVNADIHFDWKTVIKWWLKHFNFTH